MIHVLVQVSKVCHLGVSIYQRFLAGVTILSFRKLNRHCSSYCVVYCALYTGVLYGMEI